MPAHEFALTLTGQLGEVMKESALAALSYVCSHALALGLPANIFKQARVHIHVPAGVVPKDGPSAGVTMVTVLVSLVSGRKVRSDVAMTGEISLRGKVLPIGGIREKVLAAYRSGIRTVIVPMKNQPELLEDLPGELCERISSRSSMLHLTLCSSKRMHMLTTLCTGAAKAPVQRVVSIKG